MIHSILAFYGQVSLDANACLGETEVQIVDYLGYEEVGGGLSGSIGV